MKNFCKVLLVASAVLAFGCNKKSSNNLIDASVVDLGNPAVDGCGWWLKLDNGNQYYPDNLEDKYKKSGLKLEISYKLLNEANKCNFGFVNTSATNEKNVIHLSVTRAR